MAMRSIGDGDSSVYPTLIQYVPVWGRFITRIECANHACKCYWGSLEKKAHMLGFITRISLQCHVFTIVLSYKPMQQQLNYNRLYGRKHWMIAHRLNKMQDRETLSQ